MTRTRLFLIVAVLGAVFLVGMSLTWPGLLNPSGFPINRKFLAVSLNGRPFNYERMLHLPTMEVRRNGILRLRAVGHGGCNAWSGDIEFPARHAIAWQSTFTTAVGCAALATEKAYLDALLKTTRWRTEEGTLILEHGTDIIRFMLAPR